MEAWIKEITPELFPEEYRELAEDIGAENLLKLSQHAAGSPLYIPMPDYFLRPIRNQKIKEDSDKHSLKELCRKYGLSDRQIRTIINSK